MRSAVQHMLNFAAQVLRRCPGYDTVIRRYYSIDSPRRATLLGRLAGRVFEAEYWSRPTSDRARIQAKLMGGDSGVEWARRYASSFEDFPPPSDIRVGTMSWAESAPMFAELVNFLSSVNRASVLVVQLGASSGREIAALAKRFPAHSFLFTDIDESICQAARQRYSLPNLDFVSAYASDIPSVIRSRVCQEVLIFASGSAQYVFPEHWSSMLTELTSLPHARKHVVVMEPGCEIEKLQASGRGSQPRGNFSYTHDYSWYARKVGWQEIHWCVVRPYLEDDPIHGQTVHLFGWFTVNGDAVKTPTQPEMRWSS